MERRSGGLGAHPLPVRASRLRPLTHREQEHAGVTRRVRHRASSPAISRQAGHPSSLVISASSSATTRSRDGLSSAADRISRTASAGSRASSQLSASISRSPAETFAAPSMSSSAVSPASSGTGHTSSARRLATHSPSGVTAGAFDAAGLALAIMPKSASSAISPSIFGIPCEESPDSAPSTRRHRGRGSRRSRRLLRGLPAAARARRARPRPAARSAAPERERGSPCPGPGPRRPEQPKPRRSPSAMLPAAPCRRPEASLSLARRSLTAFHGAARPDRAEHASEEGRAHPEGLGTALAEAAVQLRATGVRSAETPRRY